MSSSFNTTTNLQLHRPLINPDPNPTSSLDQLPTTILRFTLCALLVLLTKVNNNNNNTGAEEKSLVWFIFFLLVAFCTSVAAIIASGGERGQATSIFHCVSVLSIALAFASVASLFLRPWFQVAAYGVCTVPLYSLVPKSGEYLLRQLNKVKSWWWQRGERPQQQEEEDPEGSMHADFA